MKTLIPRITMIPSKSKNSATDTASTISMPKMAEAISAMIPRVINSCLKAMLNFTSKTIKSKAVRDDYKLLWLPRSK